MSLRQCIYLSASVHFECVCLHWAWRINHSSAEAYSPAQDHALPLWLYALHLSCQVVEFEIWNGTGWLMW